MRKFIFKMLYYTGVHRLLHAFMNKNAVVVLCLHEVSDRLNLMYPPLTTATFKKLLDYIVNNFEVVSFNEVLKNEAIHSKKPRLILSFDDGHESFYTNVLQILMDKKIPANQNIVTMCADGGYAIWTDRFNNLIEHFSKSEKQELEFEGKKYVLGKGINNHAVGLALFLALLKTQDEKKLNFITSVEQQHEIATPANYMTWDQINTCAKNRIAIGSHSYSHATLSHLDEQHKIKELKQSKQVIEQKIDEPIELFSLPNGRSGSDLVQLAKKEGYKLVLTTQPKLWDPSKSPTVVPRIALTGKDYFESIFEMYNFHSIFYKNRFD